MVSHWSLSYKSPQFSRTLLSLQADVNNTLLSMVSNRPLISKSPLFHYQFFGDCTKSTNNNWYYSYFNVLKVFPFPRKVQVRIFHFAFFECYPLVWQDSKIRNSAFCLFFSDYYYVWSYGKDLFVKIPEEFVRLILLDSFTYTICV